VSTYIEAGQEDLPVGVRREASDLEGLPTNEGQGAIRNETPPLTATQSHLAQVGAGDEPTLGSGDAEDLAAMALHAPITPSPPDNEAPSAIHQAHPAPRFLFKTCTPLVSFLNKNGATGVLVQDLHAKRVVLEQERRQRQNGGRAETRRRAGPEARPSLTSVDR
jgi:hypothetical protein